jgi:hypothetical protein
MTLQVLLDAFLEVSAIYYGGGSVSKVGIPLSGYVIYRARASSECDYAWDCFKAEFLLLHVKEEVMSMMAHSLPLTMAKVSSECSHEETATDGATNQYPILSSLHSTSMPIRADNVCLREKPGMQRFPSCETFVEEQSEVLQGTARTITSNACE